MQAWHKKEKAKQVKKGKAEKQKLRTEKLARRNPDRIQKQIDELKAVGEEGGQMGPSDRKLLADLERDLAAVKKAKEALGEKVPERRAGGAGVKRSAGEMEEKNRRDEVCPLIYLSIYLSPLRKKKSLIKSCIIETTPEASPQPSSTTARRPRRK